MILTAILTAGLVVLGNATLLFLMLRWVARQKSAGIRALRSYFEVNDPAEQSQFAKFCELITQLLASKIAMTLKTTFMGIQSVAKKNADRSSQELIENEVSEANPIAGLILKSFPALGKKLTKNPEMLELVGKAMGRLGNGRNGHQPAEKSEFAARLNQY